MNQATTTDEQSERLHKHIDAAARDWLYQRGLPVKGYVFQTRAEHESFVAHLVAARAAFWRAEGVRRG